MLDIPDRKKPHHTDVAVGSRIRLRRTMLGISQERLAEKIGVTFQQVQKYEKGTNRVGASRLQAIGTALDISVSYFFDPTNEQPSTAERTEHDELLAFLGTREGVSLIRAFTKIQSPQARKQLLAVVRTVAGMPAVEEEHAVSESV